MKEVKIFSTKPESCEDINNCLKENPFNSLATITPENIVIMIETNSRKSEQIQMLEKQYSTSLNNKNNAILTLKITENNLAEVRGTKFDLSKVSNVEETLNKLIEQKNNAIGQIRMSDATMKVLDEMINTLKEDKELVEDLKEEELVEVPKVKETPETPAAEAEPIEA